MRASDFLFEAGGLPINPTRGETSDDHTFDDAMEYIKSNYKYIKKYTVPQASLSFFTDLKGNFLDKDQEVRHRKSAARFTAVDSFVDSFNFVKNPYYSGDHQVGKSIGYSWYVLEDKAKDIACLYYEDRGMGSDNAIIAANDKIELDKIRIELINAGIVKDPSEIKARKAELAQNRSNSAIKKGIKVGSIIDLFGDDSTLYKVISIRPSGTIQTEIIKAPNPRDVGLKPILKPGNIRKQNIR